MTDLRLDFSWKAPDPSHADDACRLARFVNGLPDFDAIYHSWLGSPETKEETVPVPLSDAKANRLLIENMVRYDLPPDPWPEAGSHIWGGHAGPPPFDFRQSSYADTLCHIGAAGEPVAAYSNSIQMRLSDLRPSTGRPWRAAELRPLMKFAREVWNPIEMSAAFSFYDDWPNIPDPAWASGERTLEPRIGWITYLPPDLAVKAKYPADVEVEILDDGAALVTLCEEPFGKDDGAGLARLHALEMALRPIQS